MPHRLELTIKGTFALVTMMRNFEDEINTVSNFYYSHSSKRKSHLDMTAEKLKQRTYALNKIRKVGWAASSARSIRGVRRNLPILFIDLRSKLKEKELEDSWPEVKGMLNHLTTRKFIFLLHFMSDFYNTMSILSESYQEDTALLIGKEKSRLNLVNYSIKSKNSYGPEVIEMLGHSRRYPALDESDIDSDNEVESHACNVEEFLTSEGKVFWNDEELTANRRQRENVLETKNSFLEILL